MTPTDEILFLRASNEVEFRCDRIEHLQALNTIVDAGIERNPLVIFDVDTLPKQIEEFVPVRYRKPLRGISHFRLQSETRRTRPFPARPLDDC
jgi:hypothetical protein